MMDTTHAELSKSPPAARGCLYLCCIAWSIIGTGGWLIFHWVLP